MSFNPGKCEVVRVTKRRNPVEYSFSIMRHNACRQYIIHLCISKFLFSAYNIEGPVWVHIAHIRLIRLKITSLVNCS